MAYLQTLIGRPSANVFRKAYIRRRQTSDGKFESDWLEITEYVKKWGTINSAVDDVRLNRFTHSGIMLTCRNDTGAFTQETQNSSLWNGYLTRYRTLVKVEGGYYDSDGNELPTDTSLGIFLLSGEIPINQKKNEAVLNCRSIVSVFDEVLATEIPGMGSTGTASEIITRIRDHTDGSGNAIFQQFISSGAWTIQTTTVNYNPATSTSLDGVSCWDLMNKLAEAEGFLLLMKRDGSFEFRDRAVRSSTSTFLFYGQGFPEQNVIGLPEMKEPMDRYFNYFRLKFDEADTSTSYATSGTVSSVDPSNPSWKYGARKYQFENLFVGDSATAQTIVDGLYNTHVSSTVKLEVTFESKFNPTVEISDQIEVNYHTYDLAGTALWDSVDWDAFNWDDETGDAIDWNSKQFRVIGRSTNLENFVTTLRLQEV